MHQDFSNKTVLIFGGTVGIGLEVARLFESCGANVYISSRSEKDTKQVGIYLPCDVTNVSDIAKVVEKVISDTGRIDILINSMGLVGTQKIEDIEVDEWNRVISTNMFGVFATCKAVVPFMKSKGYGKIVNISSVAGRHRSLTAGSHYVASKAGVIGFSRQLAYELIEYGVNVNILCPGQTLTPMLENNLTQSEIEHIGEAIPIKRIASTKEQAHPVLFLCSDAASYMSGACLDVNGGQY